MKPRTAGPAAAQGAARGATAFQQAVSLHQQGRPFQADALCAEVLRADPRHFGAWHLRGLLALEGGNVDEGMAWLQRSLALNPNQPAAHSNLGNALLAKGEPQKALDRFDRALRLKSDYAVALYNRGNALRQLRQFEEALASYDQVLRLRPDDVPALNNRGLVLLELQRLEEAVAAFERAVKLDPRFVEAQRSLGAALNDHGNVLLALGQPEAALARYDEALRLSPEAADTLYNRGAALRELKRYEESAQCFAEVLRIAPERDYALGNLFHVRMDSCDWTDYESSVRQLREALTNSRRVINPLSLLLLPELPVEVPLECTRSYVAQERPPQLSLGPCVPREVGTAARKMRVAYVSADFREHPVPYLLVGVLERHDRATFEVIGISLEKASDGILGRRVSAAFDKFIEVGSRSDREVAELLRALEVDIAVDLMGLTQGMRLGIFAHRAAPVQVSYLGFACTSGAPYIDYLIADATAIPPGEEGRYAEQVVRLPHCFLPNDDRREIALATPTRAEAGLPPDGTILCAFTNTHKINPRMFDIWMRLMRKAPDSVLWLRANETNARVNLRRAAQSRGVDPQRLIFAPQVPGMAEHLARHQLADLYLDTLPYNAHSTACDALWAGVPVLTCVSESFAGRVAASALAAVDLPELIASSLEDYEQRALKLLRDPEQLRSLRGRLAQTRERAPLFDTARYTRHLEAAYRIMQERAIRDESPLGFSVEDLQAGT